MLCIINRERDILPMFQNITQNVKKGYSFHDSKRRKTTLYCIKIATLLRGIIKVGEHNISCFSMSPISSFKSMENNHDVYRDKDCMKKFSGSLREHAMETIDLKREK